MIARQTAAEGAAILSTAIAELMEDAQGEAALVGGVRLTEMAQRAIRLKATAGDVSCLADALAILARPEPRPRLRTRRVSLTESSAPSDGEAV